MKDEMRQTIKNYLDGKLDPGQTASVRKSIESDEEWKQLLREELSLRVGLQRLAREQLKASVQFSQQAPRLRRLRLDYRWTVAAAVLLLAIAAIWWLQPGQSANSPAELYTAYYAAPPVERYRSDNSPTDSLWALAGTAYQRGEWEATLRLLDQAKRSGLALPAQSPLLRAVSQWELGLSTEALATLEIITDPDHPFYFDGLWYRALWQLKRGNLGEARLDLQKLERSRLYRERAGELRGQLD